MRCNHQNCNIQFATDKHSAIYVHDSGLDPFPAPRTLIPSLLGKRAAANAPDGTSLDGIGNPGFRIRSRGVEMDGKDETAMLVLLDADATYPGLLKQTGGVSALNLFDF